MGILIIPYYLGMLVIAVISLISVIKKLAAGEIAFSSFLLSPVLPLIGYAALLLTWRLMGSVMALAPAFMIPIVCIGLPFIATFVFAAHKFKYSKIAADAMQLSVVISAVLMIVFYTYVFEIDRWIKVKWIY
jgi:hypothetical protein